ncbi:MAG: Asp-tRNA(Asn)/Glu-tRNA(Gln) amidotransferase subunit GatA [Planctomycetota bacterium]|nr:MAG: Asp-tRNA(Asn)/Glu-tRNA(Gln) amidotransferase subunit GatA [Planctomycetota bacterium]
MSDALCWQSAGTLAAAVRRGERSAVEVLEAHLDRARAVEPRLGAFVRLCEERARRAAEEIDRRVAGGEDPGPLAGVPLGVKDNLCVRGVETTAASRILSGYLPPYTATAVARLEAAGAVVLGKLNLDEFAMGSSTETSAYGPTRNPWDPERVPGGSSGGSAASVAAGEVPLSLGSDTGGSIRQPAALCGCVGVKPTYGLVSRYGLIAFASSLDQVGPLARTCADAALALDALVGPDPRDATSASPPWDPAARPFAAAVAAASLEGRTLGVVPEYLERTADPEVRTAVEKALGAAERAGARLREVSLRSADEAIPAYQIVSTAEASSNLARYDGVRFGRRCAAPKDLEDLYARTRGEGFGREVKRRIVLGTFVLSSGFYEAYYLRGQDARRRVRADLLAALDDVDALVGPTSPVPAFRLGERLDDPLAMYSVDVFSVSANLAGLPALSLPCGFTAAGLPVGLQLTGRPFADPDLLALGRGLEEALALPKRRPLP